MLRMLCILLALLAAAPAAQARDRVLTIWAMGDEALRLAPHAREFERRNPGVRVNLQGIPWVGAHERLITAVAGEVTPDIAQLGTTWTPEFAAMGALLELDERAAASRFANPGAFFPGAVETATFDGRLVGIPWYVDTRVFFYRTDLLAEVGWDHFPETWEELRQLGADLTASGERFAFQLPTRTDQELFSFIRQAGGGLFDDAMERPIANSPETIRALAFYQSLFADGFSPRQAISALGPHQAMARGQFAAFVSGPWFVGIIERETPQLEGRWAVAPLPKGERASSFLGGANLAVFRGSQVPDLAWAFIEHMSDPATQLEWHRVGGNLPSSMAAWEDPRLKDDPRLAAFRTQLASAEPPPSIELFAAVEGLLQDLSESLVLGMRDPEEIAQRMDAGLQRILDRRRTEPGNIAEHLPPGWAMLLALVAVGGGALYLARRRLPEVWAARVPYVFLLPVLLHLGVFLFLPLAASLLMSFTNFDIYSVADWRNTSLVGLANYERLVHDALFWRSVRNTLFFVGVGAPLTIAGALVIAVVVNGALTPFKDFFRSGIFLPVVTPLVAIAVVWRWIYAPSDGVLNQMLAGLGMEPRGWLSDPSLALPALIAMSVWKNIGFSMVIFLAGLQAIPRTMYEAAEIDGAGPVDRFLSITAPLLRPTLVFVIIITTIGYMQFFAEPYIMTDRGGPEASTLSVVLHMYNHGFNYFDMGYASAIAYTLCVFIALLSLVQLRFAKGEDMA